jgi:hypothetical protein
MINGQSTEIVVFVNRVIRINYYGLNLITGKLRTKRKYLAVFTNLVNKYKNIYLQIDQKIKIVPLLNLIKSKFL